MMVDVDGRLHAYPEWLLVMFWRTNRRLLRSGAAPILDRPPKSLYLRILPMAVAVLRPLFDLPDYSPRRPLRAFDPAYSSGRAKRCGRKGLADLLACGLDAAIARREMEGWRPRSTARRSPAADIPSCSPRRPCGR